MISSGGAGVTLAQVNSAVANAIAALVSGAPDAMNTLAETSASLNDNDSAYATLLALINAKNPLMTFPSSATSTNLLSGTTLRALTVNGVFGCVQCIQYSCRGIAPRQTGHLDVGQLNWTCNIRQRRRETHSLLRQRR